MGEVIRFPVERTRKAGRCSVSCAAPRRIFVSPRSYPREGESIWKDLGRFSGDDWVDEDWSEDKPD